MCGVVASTESLRRICFLDEPPVRHGLRAVPFFRDTSQGNRMSCRTQKSQVLNHMRMHGSITTMIAFKRYGICRLSERIRELEAEAHLINHTRITRGGKSFVAYSLVEWKQAKAA